MIIKESNERVLNFRIRSVERNFSKTDSFAHSKSTHQNKRGSIKYKDLKKLPLNNLPLPSNIPPTPHLKNKDLKRIIPRNLRISRPHSKKGSLDKRQKQLDDEDNLIKITITYDSLRFQDGESVTHTSAPVLAFWPSGGKLIVVKEIREGKCKQEIEMLKQLNHPRIQQYISIEPRNQSVFLYSNYMQKGSLQSLVDSFGVLNEQLIKKITKQLIEAIDHVHSKNMVYENLKSSKLLLDENSDVRLLFGNSRYNNSTISQNSSIRQALWSSPEKILKGSGPSLQSQIWGIGCIVLNMVTAKKPWCYQSTKMFRTTAEFIKVVQSQKTPVLPKQGSQELLIFLNRCLQYNPEDRATLIQLKHTKFLKSI